MCDKKVVRTGWNADDCLALEFAGIVSPFLNRTSGVPTYALDTKMHL